MYFLIILTDPQRGHDPQVENHWPRDFNILTLSISLNFLLYMLFIVCLSVYLCVDMSVTQHTCGDQGTCVMSQVFLSTIRDWGSNLEVVSGLVASTFTE